MVRVALAASALLLTAGTASAASYSAKLTVPASGRFITRDITWSCGAAACQGASEESRPAVLCQSLAKRAGRVDSFLVDGRAFTASELDRCNGAAKAPKTADFAAQ